MSFSGKHTFSGSNSFDDSVEDGKEQGGRPNKFLYTAKTQKTGPWGNEDSFQFSEMKKDFLPNGKPNVSPSGFDLDNVWSIRKNVQVSQNVKKGPATNINLNKSTSKSFYSRHSDLIGNGDSEYSIGAKRTKRDTKGNYDSSEQKSSWSTQSRSQYSYSDQGQANKSACVDSNVDPLMNSSISNDESFVKRNNQRNMHFAMPGAPQPAVREMSARTQRAHKMQQAQLKSMGLGQFAPVQNPYFRQHDENENKVKWKKQGDDFI